jgi:hypothetical protein
MTSNGRLYKVNGTTEAKKSNPYMPRYEELLSRVNNFSIIESTLRGSFFYDE